MLYEVIQYNTESAVIQSSQMLHVRRCCNTPDMIAVPCEQSVSFPPMHDYLLDGVWQDRRVQSIEGVVKQRREVTRYVFSLLKTRPGALCCLCRVWQKVVI